MKGYWTTSHLIFAALAIVVGGGLGFCAVASISYVARQAGMDLDLATRVTEGHKQVADQARRSVADVSAALGFTDRREFVEELSFDWPTEGKIVAADLAQMKLSLIENGRATTTLDIVSKGRPGVAWETPAGRFVFHTRERLHYSSIGQVWMPYSMQFLGNYFVHGWPYDHNNVPVPLGYSGGCLRLKNEDAEKVYNFVSRGTPLYAYNFEQAKKMGDQAGHYEKTAVLPALSAQAWLVADLDTSEIITSQEKGRKLPIASLTKLMTGLVALDVIDPFKFVTASERAIATYGETGGLRPGETMEARDFIYPLLLESSNDAAEVLAEAVGRDNFIRSMNERANSIGLGDTSFEDPSGISAGNLSTAVDMFKLVRHIYHYKRFLLAVSTERERKFGSHLWHNFNPFSKTDGFLGGKNGETRVANQTYINAFALPISKDGANRNIAIIILNSLDRDGDTQKLLDYLRSSVRYAPTVTIEKASAQTGGDATTTLLFVGDIMMDRGVRRSVENNGEGDFRFLFQNLLNAEEADVSRHSVRAEADVSRLPAQAGHSVIAKADIAFGNLEGPVSTLGRNVGSIYSFRMLPAVLPVLRELGFDVLSVANNHAGDWTWDAFNDTLARLKENGLVAVGGDVSKARAEEPKIIEKNGVKFGYLGFTDVGPNWLAATESQSGILLASDPRHNEIIRNAASQVDILIVSYHFGEEYKDQPNVRQRVLAQAAIDSGAKIVAGHHPHVPEPVERYKDGVIIYSLGNFMFDQNFSEKTMSGQVVEVGIEGKNIANVKQLKSLQNNRFQVSIQ